MWKHSDDHGDRPRPLPAVRELNKATSIHERTEAPAWDFDEENSCWKWMKPPPPSRKKIQTEEPTPTQIAISAKEAKRFQYMSIKEQLRKGMLPFTIFDIASVWVKRLMLLAISINTILLTYALFRFSQMQGSRASYVVRLWSHQ